MPAPACRHVTIKGQVQGVGYRASMADEARRLGVNGWVRNRRDGSVEALICGDDLAIANLIAWARRGPQAAQVDHLEIELGEGEFNGFALLPTL